MDRDDNDACAPWRDLYGPTLDVALKKQLAVIDRHARAFIARSPFLTMATVDADGRADCSPRGDEPGFVRVLDDKTLLLPDRPGNNRLDSLTNVQSHPSVGLLFLIQDHRDAARRRPGDHHDRRRASGCIGGPRSTAQDRASGERRRGLLPLHEGAGARKVVVA